MNASPNNHPPTMTTVCGEYSFAHTIVNGPPIDINAISNVPIKLMRAVDVPVNGVFVYAAISS